LYNKSFKGVSHCLGVAFSKERKKIYQAAYTRYLLNGFGMTDSKPASTLTKTEEEELSKVE
jgi:hypothetical protein